MPTTTVYQLFVLILARAQYLVAQTAIIIIIGIFS